MKKSLLLLLILLGVSGSVWPDAKAPLIRNALKGNGHPTTTANTGNFRVANVLQSHMVIQQAKPFRVWGTAPAGDTIVVKPGWGTESILVRADRQGQWAGQIPVPAAPAGNFTAHTLSFIYQQDTLQLTDILIGEVWLCSGQSNMDMELKPSPPWLKGVIDYQEEIAGANHPAIRFINIATDLQKQPVSDTQGNWQVCTPQTAGDLSGVAYFFGRELLGKLKVPVGLVVSSVGGSGCQAWTSRQVLEADPVLKAKYLDPYDLSPQAKERLDSAVTMEKLFEILVRPTLLYNAMIHPLKNLSIRGFLWYQGESNKLDGSLYTRLCTAMLEGWRKDFEQRDLPFYYVQMTPYNWEEKDPMATYYAHFREAQEAMLRVKNTGMAVTMDIGEVDDIHPRNKKDVGIRLAKIAFHQTYNFKDVVSLGPSFNAFKARGNTVKVSFASESIGSGLTTTDQQPPRHFFMAGEDKVFYEAEARIVGKEVWLTCPKVKKPVAVRYAFTNYPITNLSNKEGLPALPFRTDNWDK